MSNAVIPPYIGQKDLTYRLRVRGFTYKTAKPVDKNCKRTGCHGRGWVGLRGEIKQPMPCTCVGRFDLIHEPGGGGTEDGPLMNRGGRG